MNNSKTNLKQLRKQLRLLCSKKDGRKPESTFWHKLIYSTKIEQNTSKCNKCKILEGSYNDYLLNISRLTSNNINYPIYFTVKHFISY